MKTKITWLTIALCGGGLALAEDAVKPRPEGKPPGKPGERRLEGGPGAMFEKFDKNGDKQLSKEEVPEKAWEFISKADADKNNLVTREELEKAGPGRNGGGMDPKKLFGMADKNGDGKITQDEAGERWERLGKLDANGDKSVSMEEFGKIAGRFGGPGGPGSPGEGGRGNPGEMFARADKNNDGKIGKEEVPAELWERMSRLDKNSDGFITKDELPAPGAGGPGVAGRPGAPGAGPGAMFGQMDKNSDGKIAKDEVNNPEMWTRLLKADDNGDGLISQEELKASYEKRPGAAGTEKKPAEVPAKKETAA
ncbi:MAG: EF-hand domain-containing protein [Verrucomicrobiales bacterium]|nr:hypothetical protein [Verrucomicrobiae bacterium]